MQATMERLAKLVAESRDELEALKKSSDLRDHELRTLIELLEAHMRVTEIILAHYFDSIR